MSIVTALVIGLVVSVFAINNNTSKKVTDLENKLKAKEAVVLEVKDKK